MLTSLFLPARGLRPRVAAAVILSSGFAPAAASAQSATLAEALFQDGQKLFASGDTHAACLKFAESQREDPGLGTLLHLALCHEKEGKPATAWAEFVDAAAQSQQQKEPEREAFAKQHAAALEKQLHRVVLEMLSPPADLQLKVDGAVLGAGSLGTAMPLDPGEHFLEATARGKKPWTQRLALGPSAITERLEIPPLEDDPGTARGATAAQSFSILPKEAPPSPRPAEDAPKRIAGWVATGVGVGLLGLATYYALTAASRSDDMNHAPDQAIAHTLHEQAVSAEVYGYVFGGVGVAAAGTGLYLLLTSVTSSHAAQASGAWVRLSPVVGSGRTGLSIAGTF
jgi:hypothetical protein